MAGEVAVHVQRGQRGYHRRGDHLLRPGQPLRESALLGGRHLSEGMSMALYLELEPTYSSTEIPGRCIKCLAEEQCRDCLRELLRGGSADKELEETYKALVSLLTSPELGKLRAETERYLAEGRDVKVILHPGEGELRYEIDVSLQPEEGV
jgi:hypothetical protein